MLNQRLKNINEKMKAAYFFLNKTAELESAWVKLADCNKQGMRLAELIKYAQNLKDVKNRIGIGIKYVRERRKYIRESLKEYEAVLRKMGRCPVCLSEVDSHTIDRIITQFGGARREGE